MPPEGVARVGRVHGGPRSRTAEVWISGDGVLAKALQGVPSERTHDCLVPGPDGSGSHLTAIFMSPGLGGSAVCAGLRLHPSDPEGTCPCVD